MGGARRCMRACIVDLLVSWDLCKTGTLIIHRNQTAYKFESSTIA